MSTKSDKTSRAEEYLTSFKSSTEEEEELMGSLDLLKILNVVKNNIIWVVLIPALCIAGGYIFLRYTTPIYESASSIKLEVKQKAGALGIPGMPNPEEMTNISGEIELIKSNLIYDEVLRRLDFSVGYYAYGRSRIKNEEKYRASPFKLEYEVRNPAVYDQPFDVTFLNEDQFLMTYTIDGVEQSKKYSFDQLIDTDNFRFVIHKTEHFSPQSENAAFYFVIHSVAALNHYLASNLRIEVMNQSANIIGIFFKDPNVFKAHDIINTIDTVYLTKTKELKNKANKQKISFLEEQLRNTEAKLEVYESQLEKFVVDNKSANIQGDVDKYVGKIEALEEGRMEVSTQLSLLNSLKTIIDNKGDLTSFIPTIPLLQDAQLVALTSDINRQQQERAMMANSRRETTYALQATDKAISLTRASISSLIEQNKKLLHEKYAKVSQEIQKLENTFAGLPAKGTEYNRIKRLKDLTEKYYLVMIDKKAELGIAEAGTVEEFVVLASASIPSQPIYPNKFIVYAGCAFAGIFISLMLVGFKYFLHDTISNQRELERNTTAPILGIIPTYMREKLAVSRLIVHKNPKASISEALRSIRTNLEFIFPTGQRKKSISITSTISGEGKTFVAINLSGVIALSNTKVILLDLDMRRPKVHQAFDEENYNGISTLLIGKHTIKECIRKTPIDNLDFIAAGPTPPNPSELILRPEFDTLLKELHQLYDVIVIDTPPIGLVTDGVLVMRKVDLPVYVVRANFSKRVFLKNINKLIKNNNFSKLAVVLNAFKTTGQYGYGYGYTQNYYEDDEEQIKGFEKLKGLLTKIK